MDLKRSVWTWGSTGTKTLHQDDTVLIELDVGETVRHRDRWKHIDVEYHYMYNRVESGGIQYVQ